MVKLIQLITLTWEEGIEDIGLRLRIGIMVGLIIVLVGYALLNQLQFNGLSYLLIFIITVITSFVLDKSTST